MPSKLPCARCAEFAARNRQLSAIEAAFADRAQVEPPTAT
jgi:hypothetical protein